MYTLILFLIGIVLSFAKINALYYNALENEENKHNLFILELSVIFFISFLSWFGFLIGIILTKYIDKNQKLLELNFSLKYYIEK